MPNAVSLTACLLLLSGLIQADTTRRTINNGNLILEDIPPIPATLQESLRRYQNVRSAGFLDWSDQDGLYVRTRFGDVSQIHHVTAPGAARTQLTFFDEPVGGAIRRPRGRDLAFTMDAGGNEFSQIFLLDPASGASTMLTDGESRNGSILWDTTGERLAYHSTRRNGRSNDVWIMRPDDPTSARLAFAAPDGSAWFAADFARGSNQLLLTNYISINEARAHLLDLTTGKATLLTDAPGFHYPAAFNAADDAYFFYTDRGGEFVDLAIAPLSAPGDARILTADIPWDVDTLVLSADRRRGAFVVNADGQSELYLLDARTERYRRVSGLPTGLIGNLAFAPDGKSLAMTLNTARTPSDTFVLALTRQPTRHGKLTRWTTSEVGGLDTTGFVVPTLERYPTFDGRSIPVFVYAPPGPGPHPVIVSIHGGPEGQARPAFSSTYQMWIDRLGAAVVVPNVRGSSGYGKSWLKLDNGRKREDSVRDIGALLDWIETRDTLDQRRVAVYGGSYGGYMVLASAVHYSDRLVAAVDVVGISNFVTFLENTQEYRQDLRRVEYGDERDPDMRRFLQSISPLNHLGKITVPLLVVQGQNDPRVPVTESEQLVQGLRQRGQQVWYMNAMNEGHGYARKENRDTYQQATVLFLERHLGR